MEYVITLILIIAGIVTGNNSLYITAGLFAIAGSIGDINGSR